MYEGKELTKYVPEGQSPKLYIDLIKGQIMKPDRNGKERSNTDLLLFLYVAKRTGLDPLTKQIYAVFRWDFTQGKEVMAIQTGIDGMRLIAQRTGEYAGQDEVVFTPEDESEKYPTKATVTVYKLLNGTRVPFTATARWREYAPYTKDKNGGNPKLGAMWEKMPYTMLGKCAEALALRKGFPNELSGVYSDEEMQQATPREAISELPVPEKFKKPEVLNTDIAVQHGAPSNDSQTLQHTESQVTEIEAMQNGTRVPSTETARFIEIDLDAAQKAIDLEAMQKANKFK